MKTIYHELVQGARNIGLKPESFGVELVSLKVLKQLQQHGYRRRFVEFKPRDINGTVLELFDVLDRVVYIRNDVPRSLQTFMMAHCVAHADFLVRNHELKRAVHRFRRQFTALRSQYEWAKRQSTNHFQTYVSKLEELFSNVLFRRCDMDWLMDHVIRSRTDTLLWQVMHNEAQYFEAIGKTSLMNEGWAMWQQNQILNKSGLISQAFGRWSELLCEPTSAGINVYRLGLRLWTEATDPFYICQMYDDQTFIGKLFSKEIHDEEVISLVHHQSSQVTRDFETVKQQLQYTAVYSGKLPIYLDTSLTKQTGDVTFRYPFNRYEQNRVKNVRSLLESCLGQRVMIKPSHSRL
ncbi:spore cortex formation protein SpoVR/YcgB (stage V sporulation) [Alkalibacillus flavidus]|uniref:Spore cortex formation protein SpoVR/YcgB (Stage V sporulation) n=1 Tax=Alkalibacillus flavidus TaxID=546021 RepID=A0ABV2KVC5_9BACI